MNDVQQVYTDFLFDIKKTARFLPVLILAGLGYGGIKWIFERFFFSLRLGSGGFLVGFLRWFLIIALLTHFATVMSRLFSHEKLTVQDLLRFDVGHYPPLAEALFLVYIVEWMITRFGIGIGGGWLLILWQIFTAPAFEAVYIGHEASARLLPSLVEFWKTNWLPALIFSFVALIGYQGVLPMLVQRTNLLAEYLIFNVCMAIFLYAKALLFRILYFSNPRLRAFHRGRQER